jgi:5-(carboxyamino)imidazole ribonucleotide synthase
MINPILPPATIGILGSGQLGRMLALAARQMGYRVHVLSPDSDSPTGQIADREFVATYEDLDAVRQFAQGVDVVTYEFENVPGATAVTCAQFAPLHPGPQALHIAQNRLREKEFMVRHGLPVTPFAEVGSLAGLLVGLEKIGAPAILKTATSGYDGKGQEKIVNRQSSIVNRHWEAIGQQPAILEAFVEFEREVSVVAARGADGSFAHFGVIENDHANHILDVSTTPAERAAKSGTRRGRDGASGIRGAGCGGRVVRRVLSDGRRPSPHQRDRPPPPQLRPPDHRSVPHQPIRAAAPRRLRPAPGRHPLPQPRRHG